MQQVTPSVTPTSSLSSNDTRSTYANNLRGTPNSRNSVDGHSAAAISDMAASVAMRGSLALDAGLFRRNYSPAAAATYGTSNMCIDPRDGSSAAWSPDHIPDLTIFHKAANGCHSTTDDSYIVVNIHVTDLCSQRAHTVS